MYKFDTLQDVLKFAEKHNGERKQFLDDLAKVYNGSRIAAIKLYRNQFDTGLREAKDAVYSVMSRIEEDDDYSWASR